MPDLPAEQNPYAPPDESLIAESSEDLLKSVARMYRTMGWIGLTVHLIVLPIPLLFELTENPPTLTIAGLVATGLLLQCLFFNLMILTANSMEADLPRVRKRVRWMGVLAAGFWFPWLTVPVVIAFRKLDRFDKTTSVVSHSSLHLQQNSQPDIAMVGDTRCDCFDD